MVYGCRVGMLGSLGAKKKPAGQCAGGLGGVCMGALLASAGKSLFAAVLGAFADHGTAAWRWSPGAFPRPGPAAIGQLLGALAHKNWLMARLRLAAGCCGSCSLWGVLPCFYPHAARPIAQHHHRCTGLRSQAPFVARMGTPETAAHL